MVLRVLYEDNHLIAVFKPAGVLTQGDHSGEPSLMDHTRAWLKEKYQKPGNVFLGLLHRLDKPVAGVVVYGKTSKGASRLSEQFRSRQVKKIYRAWVEGNLETDEGELEHDLDWDEARRKAVVSGNGKKSRLAYRVVRREAERSLIEIDLETGRKHQIRAQLSAIHHPVVGDEKYGSRLKTNLELLCTELEFSHPTRPEERIHLKTPDEILQDRGMQ